MGHQKTERAYGWDMSQQAGRLCSDTLLAKKVLDINVQFLDTSYLIFLKKNSGHFAETWRK